MTEDARFEDAGGGALRLRALDAEDLQVISSLCQDAVFGIGDIAWKRGQRRFAVLLNRLRREDRRVAGGVEVERVRAVLAVEDVSTVRTLGIDRDDPELVLSLLSIAVEPGPDGTGRLILTLAGDGAIAVEVETLDVLLRDVTRPYRALSGKLPAHD